VRVASAGKGYEHLTAVIVITKNCPLQAVEPGEQAELGLVSSKRELFISRLFENAEEAPLSMTACSSPGGKDLSF
jgi:hypothetical protein